MYRKIANAIIDKIEREEYAPGDKLPTESELGETYGVSRITVTHAIRILQDRNLVYRVKGSGTFVTQKLIGGHDVIAAAANSMSFISVIFPHGEQNGAHETLMGIESECAKGDFYVTIHNSRNKPAIERGIIANLQEQGCRGIIVYPCSSDQRNLDIYSELIIHHFPFVLIDRHIDFLDVPSVTCDNEAAMRDMVAHVIGKGHRRIGFYSSSIATVSSERERYVGYCDAHITAGLSVQPDLLFDPAGTRGSDTDGVDLDERAIYRNAEHALSHFMNRAEKPTCIVAVNDISAVMLLKAAIARGLRVPEDLAITGFDDLTIAAHIEVPLTTVRQPFAQIGVEAARFLLERIRGNAKQNYEIRVPGEIVLRQSAP